MFNGVTIKSVVLCGFPGECELRLCGGKVMQI